jgi:hypothetical protein
MADELSERVEQASQHFVFCADHVRPSLGEQQRLIQIDQGSGIIGAIRIRHLLGVSIQFSSAGGDCLEAAALRGWQTGETPNAAD